METAGAIGDAPFHGTLAPQPCPEHYEYGPFPLVPYETSIFSSIHKGFPLHDCTGSSWTGDPHFSSDYSLPPDAVVTGNGTSHFADYSEPDMSGASVSDVQIARNYEVLNATTLDPKPCYSRLKLGKHTVV